MKSIRGHVLSSRTKIIGVGGAGCNIIRALPNPWFSGVEIIVAHIYGIGERIDGAHSVLALGEDACRGHPTCLGLTVHPRIKSLPRLRGMLDGARLAIVTGGLAGSHTSAVFMAAKAARDSGAVTLCVVTTPYAFEGRRRMQHARVGLVQLRRAADAVFVIPLDSQLKRLSKTATVSRAFSKADVLVGEALASLVEWAHMGPGEGFTDGRRPA